jgi:hypothetical protein
MQRREMRLSVGAIVSSVAACIACVVFTATVAPDKVADVLISRSANVG